MESATKNTNTLKINNNNNKSNNIFGSGDNDYDADEIEIRPIRRKDAVQAGMDYWIDDSDFEREKQRRIAIKNRKVSIYIYICYLNGVVVDDACFYLTIITNYST